MNRLYIGQHCYVTIKWKRGNKRPCHLLLFKKKRKKDVHSFRLFRPCSFIAVAHICLCGAVYHYYAIYLHFIYLQPTDSIDVYTLEWPIILLRNTLGFVSSYRTSCAWFVFMWYSSVIVTKETAFVPFPGTSFKDQRDIVCSSSYTAYIVQHSPITTNAAAEEWWVLSNRLSLVAERATVN